MPDNPPLVLASSSPWRRELLSRLGLAFECASPDIDETPQPGETASTLVQRLAGNKAHALGARFPQHLIIGSDQVATLDDIILGKPGSHDRACEQLALCSAGSSPFIRGWRFTTRPAATQMSRKRFSGSTFAPVRRRYRPLPAARATLSVRGQLPDGRPRHYPVRPAGRAGPEHPYRLAIDCPDRPAEKAGRGRSGARDGGVSQS